MKFYGMTDAEVLKMPIRTFWASYRYIVRIRAEEDLRLLPLLRAAQNTEMFNHTVETLKEEMGQIVQQSPLEETLDRNGLDSLRHL